jgi:CHAT domain-containing protein
MVYKQDQKFSSAISLAAHRRRRGRLRDQVMGCLILFGVSVLLIVGLAAISEAQPPPLAGVPAPAPATAPSSQGRQLLQAGIGLYETERFSAAIPLWQQAVATLQAEADPLGQALALSNLSLTYQQLARWPEAEGAIAQSLAVLKPVTPATPSYDAILAKALNTQGNLLWAQGQADLALKAWQAAARHYQSAGNLEGGVLAQINQVRALQDLGLNTRAVDQLEQIDRFLASQPAVALKAIGLRDLGEAYRRIGNLERSQQILQASVASAQNPGTNGAALLELGNTQKSLSDRAIALGQQESAQVYAQAAIQSYRAAAQAADSSILQLQAQINQLKVLMETGQWSEAATLWPQIQPRITQLPVSRTAIYAQLNFAASLSCLKQISLGQRLTCISPERQESLPAPSHLSTLPDWDKLAQQVARAVDQARDLADPLTESYALGQLGGLYELTGQWTEAQTLTQQALFRLEGMQAPEAAYQWAWQLGRLFKQQNQRPQAIAAYREAIHSLETVQRDLLVINRETRFSFRDQAEPVYREYVDLLLLPEEGQSPSQSRLKLAIQTIDALQLGELKNFLGCELPLVRIDETTVDPKAAKIYPILLPDRLAIIFEIANEPLGYFEAPVSRQAVEATVKTLRSYLTEPGQTPEVLQVSRQLYQWLVAPLEPMLAQHPQIKTLVFVPDRELRNVPMGVLYDGSQYLIEKAYAIAIAPRLELFQPKPLSPNLSILAGGVGIPQKIQGASFPEIKQLREEIAQIPAAMITTPPLFDQAFTTANIEQRLQTGNYSAIHWKTHGVFSSDPMETYIVAYESSIRTNDLIQIVQGARQSRALPLELLVLSACETARGDNRAVLGMAGTAMNAGASSILSTLWRADDAANTALMADFYQALTQPGTTRAEALRKAQLALLTRYGYAAPYYWATYVLVGNWL